jgi:hypothetical protein
VATDWDAYQPYDAGVTEPLQTLSRAQARRVYERCMESKAERLGMLCRLLSSDGVNLTSTDSSIQDLNDWFLANLEADPQQPGRLGSVWYSVCHDIALFLGDVMIERHPNLRWEFFTWGKSNVSYQQHVIMGFSTEDPKFRTNFDVAGSILTYGYRIIESRGSVATYGTVVVRGATIDIDAISASHRTREIEIDAFWRWLQIASRRA